MIWECDDVFCPLQRGFRGNEMKESLPIIIIFGVWMIITLLTHIVGVRDQKRKQENEER